MEGNADMADRLKFWLSDQGMREWEDTIERHYAKFLGEIDHKVFPIGFLPHVPAEVILIQRFPAPRRVTLITRGLSGFILADPVHRCNARQEFAISILDTQLDSIGKPLLAIVSDFTLGRARFLEELQAIPESVTTNQVKIGDGLIIVPFIGIWLPPEVSQIDSEIPAYITEISALSRRDYQILKSDFNEFKRVSEESGVDYTDFLRST